MMEVELIVEKTTDDLFTKTKRSLKERLNEEDDLRKRIIAPTKEKLIKNGYYISEKTLIALIENSSLLKNDVNVYLSIKNGFAYEIGFSHEGDGLIPCSWMINSVIKSVIKDTILPKSSLLLI